MLSILFQLYHFIPLIFYDAYRQNKSESIYWYGENNQGGYYNEKASDASSHGQFGFWYYFVILNAIILYALGYFQWYQVISNIAFTIFLHWCGVEDLGYSIVSMIKYFNHPEGYYQRHPSTKICGIELPKESYWLSKARELFGFITIPSIIGFICGERVPAKKFFLLSIGSIIFIILLSITLDLILLHKNITLW